MYAIVKTGGKQYRVEEGQSLLVERLPADDGAQVPLQPLLVVDGSNIVDTSDGLSKVSVEARIVGHERGPKLRVVKFKPKRGYKRRTGHRQELTRIEVTGIKLGTRRASSKRTPKPAAAEATTEAAEAATEAQAAEAQAAEAATEAQAAEAQAAEAPAAEAQAPEAPAAEAETPEAPAAAPKRKPATRKPATRKPSTPKAAAETPDEPTADAPTPDTPAADQPTGGNHTPDNPTPDNPTAEADDGA